jgi:hypothetical protein
MEHSASTAGSHQAPRSAREAQSLEIVVLEDGLQDVTFAEGSDGYGALTWTIADSPPAPFPAAVPAPAPVPAQAPASPLDSERELAFERELARKDAKIRELESVLEALRPLAEDAGKSELSRLAAEQRAAICERELADLLQRLTLSEAALAQSQGAAAALRDACEARAVELAGLRERVRQLEHRVRDRDGVLRRERERHAATRAKLAERSKVASERWAEIRRLRSESD